jgi:RNA polymerase sigma-70 factor, ECF subfamily
VSLDLPNFPRSISVPLMTDSNPQGAELDLIVIRRCQAGDEEAFALLFEEYKNLVYRAAFLTLGNAADAEDVLQEVFIQVHHSVDSYDPRHGAFTTWLHRITVNRCLNWRCGLHRAESLEKVAEEPAGNTAPPADRFAEDDCVRRALGNLSRKLRVVVILRHHCDLSYAQIADIMDLPLGTVKSRLNLALRLLHDDLKADFPCQTRSVTEVQR